MRVKRVFWGCVGTGFRANNTYVGPHSLQTVPTFFLSFGALWPLTLNPKPFWSSPES